MLRRPSPAFGVLLICASAAMMAVAGPAPAQDAPADTSKRVLEIGKWYPFVEAGLNLNQSSYTQNWNGGDKSSVVWAALLNANLENQLSSKVNSYSILKLAYGQTHQQEEAESGERYWDRPEKSTDLVDLESILRFTLGGFVDPYVSARFESQFEDATDPDRTLSLNPLKFRESAGIARKWIDTNERQLLTRLGATFRQSSRKYFVNPAPDPTTASESANDGGLEFVADYQSKVLANRVTWTSKLSVYQPVFFSGDDEFDLFPSGDLAAVGVDPEVGDYTKAVDFDWENIFATQITKILTVNLYVRWVYDKYDNTVMPRVDGTGSIGNPEEVQAAIRKAGQLKQTLAIGLTYRLL